MSPFCSFVLIFSVLVTTFSSPIDEPIHIESPLAEGDDDASSSLDLTQHDDSTVNLTNTQGEQKPRRVKAHYINCTQWDNSCSDCIQANHCLMVHYYKDDLLDFKCFDQKTTAKEIMETNQGWYTTYIFNVTDCPKASGNDSDTEGAKSNSNPSITESYTDQTTTTESETNTTTTSTSTTTTTPATTNTTSTSTSSATSSQNVTISTTSSTTNTTNSTTSSSTSSTSKPTTSKEAPPPPSGGGWSFWSFFGGILLTLGLFAIGFVGFKYYKARSLQSGGGGLTYNRF